MTTYVQHSEAIEDELIEAICEDGDTMIDLLECRDDMECDVADKISNMNETEIRTLWADVIHYDIDEAIQDAAVEANL